MSKDSEGRYWENKSRARRGRRPKLSYTDKEHLAKETAEIAMLASVLSRMIIPKHADEIDELPREIRTNLLRRSSQKPTENQ